MGSSLADFVQSKYKQKSLTLQYKQKSLTLADAPPGAHHRQMGEPVIPILPPPMDDEVKKPPVRNWLNPKNLTSQDNKIKNDAFREKQMKEKPVTKKAKNLSERRDQPHKRRRQRNLENKPFLLLHAGLPKTGTTFLQCSLCGHANVTEPILRQDNFVYLGTCPHYECGVDDLPPQFLHHWHPSFFWDGQTKEPRGNVLGPFPHLLDPKRVFHEEQGLPRVNQDLIERLSTLHEKNYNVLVVFEGLHIFSERHIEALSKLLLPLWNVHIVVAYRPLYDWLPSKYNSVNKPDRNRAGRVWPNMAEPDHPDRKGATILPFDIDNRYTFSDYVAELEHKYLQHPTQIVRDNYAQFFGTKNVHVMPLHILSKTGKGDAMLEYIFCSLIPKLLAQQNQEVKFSSLNTCTQVRLGIIDHAEQLNPSVELNYDLLAVEAYKQGLFQVVNPRRPRTKRSTIAAAAQDYQENFLTRTVNDFSLQCFNATTLERLMQLSLLTERKLFTTNQDGGISKNEWTELDEQLLRKNFESAVAKHKFCHVDAQKVLATDEVWRSFFQNVADRSKYIEFRKRVRAQEKD